MTNARVMQVATSLNSALAEYDNNVIKANYYDKTDINGYNTYSTDETFTGKYWINGKPIYRKCVYIDSIASTSDTHAVADFDMSNIDCIVSGFYSGLNGTIWYIGFYGRLEEGGSAKFLIQLDNNKIYMVNRHTIRKFSFIVEYTKL